MKLPHCDNCQRYLITVERISKQVQTMMVPFELEQLSVTGGVGFSRRFREPVPDQFYTPHEVDHWWRCPHCTADVDMDAFVTHQLGDETVYVTEELAMESRL